MAGHTDKRRPKVKPSEWAKVIGAMLIAAADNPDMFNFEEDDSGMSPHDKSIINIARRLFPDEPVHKQALYAATAAYIVDTILVKMPKVEAAIDGLVED